MTQEEKSLLLIDLCSRLPYGVIIQVKDWTSLNTELKIGHIQRLQNNDIELKPYLRPLSSMTKEEYEELRKIDRYYGIAPLSEINDWEPGYKSIDWLNKNHYDYRGLIPKGLAIAVTKENNPYED